MTTLKNNL